MSASGDLISAKVRPRDRIGTDGWLTFHAAYSRSFAKRALTHLAEKGDTVLDTFSGSGTTSRAAADLGINSIGVELNPALVALARGTLTKASVAETVIGLMRGARPRLSSIETTPLVDEWLHNSTGRQLRWWSQWARDLPDDKARAFAQAVLVRASRGIIAPALGTNPTWPKPPKRRTERHVKEHLLDAASAMKADLLLETDREEGTTHEIRLGNSRELDLEDNSVSAVLTSPPYLSRIDYVRATLPELIALGWDSEERVAEFRRAVMGGVLARRIAEGDIQSSVLAKETLASMCAHSSKASRTYYQILAKQYFDDLDSVIAHIGRVLRPGGRAMVVVQTSYYKNILVPLPEIVAEMGVHYALGAKILRAEPVKQHFGHLSPAQRSYVKKKVLSEAVVLLTK